MPKEMFYDTQVQKLSGIPQFRNYSVEITTEFADLSKKKFGY